MDSIAAGVTIPLTRMTAVSSVSVFNSPWLHFRASGSLSGLLISAKCPVSPVLQPEYIIPTMPAGDDRFYLFILFITFLSIVFLTFLKNKLTYSK